MRPDCVKFSFTEVKEALKRMSNDKVVEPHNIPIDIKGL
jgi:hypothetical protein